MNDWEVELSTRLMKLASTNIRKEMQECDQKNGRLSEELVEELFEDSTKYFEKDSERSNVIASEYFDFTNEKKYNKHMLQVRIGDKYQASIPPMN